MEQWLRDNKLNESGAQSALDAIVQASQLLQARKTDTDVDSICEMCSKLTIAQVSVLRCSFLVKCSPSGPSPLQPHPWWGTRNGEMKALLLRIQSCQGFYLFKQRVG